MSNISNSWSSSSLYCVFTGSFVDKYVFHMTSGQIDYLLPNREIITLNSSNLIRDIVLLTGVLLFFCNKHINLEPCVNWAKLINQPKKTFNERFYIFSCKISVSLKFNQAGFFGKLYLFSHGWQIGLLKKNYEFLNMISYLVYLGLFSRWIYILNISAVATNQMESISKHPM
jgi:hypothetical protein